MSTKLKDGIKTSEFVLTVVIAALVQLNILQVGNDKQKGWITAALAIAYSLSRGLAKLFPPKDEAVGNVTNMTTSMTAVGDVDELPHVPATGGPIPPDQGDKGAV